MKMPHLQDELENNDSVDEVARTQWRVPSYRMHHPNHHNHQLTAPKPPPMQPQQPPPPLLPPHHQHQQQQHMSHYYNYPHPHQQWYQPPPPMTAFHAPPPMASVYASVPSHEYNSEFIVQVTDLDVLCGRGAPTSYHPGNQYFRMLVKDHKQAYLASKRCDKPQIASQIVDIIQERGGRFLKRSKTTTTYLPGNGRFVWTEIGDEKAYEKTCQALREGAPELRRRLDEDNRSPDDSGEEDRDGDREQFSGENSSGHE